MKRLPLAILNWGAPGARPIFDFLPVKMQTTAEGPACPVITSAEIRDKLFHDGERVFKLVQGLPDILAEYRPNVSRPTENRIQTGRNAHMAFSFFG